MTAQECLRLLIAKDLQLVLKVHGFRKKALNFYRRAGGNFAVVQFQKSRTSSAMSVDFTINLGVFSACVQQGLAPILWVPSVEDVPTEPDCHLRRRIGLLLPEHQDVWWNVREDTDRGKLGATLVSLLEKYAFPFLDRRASDEGLRDHWLLNAEEAWGREGLSLAVLLRALGPRAALGPLLERLRRDTPPTAHLLVSAIDKFSASMTSLRP